MSPFLAVDPDRPGGEAELPDRPAHRPGADSVETEVRSYPSGSPSARGQGSPPVRTPESPVRSKFESGLCVPDTGEPV